MTDIKRSKVELLWGFGKETCTISKVRESEAAELHKKYA